MLKKIILLLSLFIACFSSTLLAQNSTNTTLMANLPYPAESSLSGVWGYAANNKEYAIVGYTGGTSIVDVSQPSAPVQIAHVDGVYSFWREIKTFKNYAYVVDDQAGEGLLIIDLSKLPEISYKYIKNIDGANITKSHTIFIDEKGICYLFGSSFDVGGCIMLDLNADPENPTLIGMHQHRYIHDGYVRNDTLWAAQINDGYIEVVDIKDKLNPKILAEWHTPHNFSHNCWLSPDSKTLFTTDEVDGAWITSYDVSNLSDVKELDRIHRADGSQSIPHNVFVKGNFLVTSHYSEGVVVHDASDPKNLIEVAHYDTSPTEGGGFKGAWGVYPYLPSGNILVADMETGLYIVKPDLKLGAALSGNVKAKFLGTNVAGATIELLTTPGTATTNFNGNFATGAANSGNYAAVFKKFGYETLTVNDIALENGKTTTLNVEILPLTPFTLNGKIIDQFNQPVPNAIVNISNDLANFEIKTNDKGEFKVPEFYQGIYNFEYGAWGYTSGENLAYTVALFNPEIVFTIENGVYRDYFNIDYGWKPSGTSLLDGGWVREIPVGSDFGLGLMNPDSDVANDKGNKCYMTGNNKLENFVVGGFENLTSPEFDITQYKKPYLSCYIWFVNLELNNNPGGNLALLINNGSKTDTLVNLLPTDLLSSVEGWKQFSFDLTKLDIPITPTMKFSLSAYCPTSNEELVEAGLDWFEVGDSLNIISGYDRIAIEELILARISPNPANQTAILQISDAMLTPQQPAYLQIFNSEGRLVLRQLVTSQQQTINTQNLPQGIYLYKITNKKGLTAEGKLQILH
ncbi:MAG: choice-of-anchor B family protein [Chitinophagales bacterium]|jgi:choice-of-anchor B domain-containing protein|nr:choice-of-anchor B family protein [Sphingobacteriales bacterium]MBP9141658.1 choice-of-anchor B family protein [Chitinophagales bacterium]MDA0197489.1 choice-of-anchor B family protein [Bacteroidota bacterium]MBK6890324.1 choice-of-anchor B family protein [Sphingobacteriales bacterium]MBK8678511.1 choice-of-anchor B family protein [Sphingobacteriales bacterium]